MYMYKDMTSVAYKNKVTVTLTISSYLYMPCLTHIYTQYYGSGPQDKQNYLFDLDIYGQGHSDLIFICNTRHVFVHIHIIKITYWILTIKIKFAVTSFCISTFPQNIPVHVYFLVIVSL
jgi:hypothetical protein